MTQSIHLPGSRTGFLKALVFTFSCVAVASCGGGGGGTTISSTPTGTVGISVDSTSLSFGKVVIGQTTQRAVTITNTGTLQLTNVQLTNPVEGFSAAGPCATIAAGAKCEIVVKFTPLEQKAYGGSFNIQSSAPTLSLNLSGQGQGLNVEVSNVTNSCVDPTVSIRIIVSGADNTPITFLNESNFLTVVDEFPLEPASFTGITENEPLSVALAVDWSGSLELFRDTLTQAAEVFVDTLAPTDTAAFYRFGAEVDVNKQDFVLADAAGKIVLKDALYVDFQGDTDFSNIWSAADYARTELVKETNQNRAIILLTDGRNNFSGGLSLQGLIENALADDINIFTLGFGDILSAPLEELAQESGGLYFESPDAQGLNDIYQNIVSVLTNRYEFSLILPNPSAESQLTVVVRDDQGNEGEDTRTLAACP